MATHLLLVSGSTRTGSTGTAVLRTAAALAPTGTTTSLYDGLVDLPAFVPDAEPLPAAVVDLRAALGAADAVLFCTPEYAGSLPGSLKNLLDWSVGGGELYGTPAGWLNVASVGAPTGGAGAHAQLATVLGYVGADVVAEACLRAPVRRDDVGPDGLVHDPEVRRQVVAAVGALVARVLAVRGPAS